MRRFLVPVGLVVLAVLAGAGAWWVGRPAPGRDGATPPARVDRVVVTPLLSPRRVPGWLAQPTADERLRLGVQPVIDEAPPDTCLVVDQARRTIVDRQADLAVVPASNQKLVTGQVALDVLGPDHRFTTRVLAPASPVEGRVEELRMIGGGDPVLGTEDFLAGYDEAPPHTSLEALAQAVADAGVTEVSGDVVADASRYDGVTTVPSWAPRDYGTATPGPLVALAVNRGYTTYATEPDAVVIPEPSDDAPTGAATALIQALEARGVTVAGGARTGTVDQSGPEVASVTSPPLREIVALIEGYSDNTASELLVKELGYVQAGEGSTEAGLEVMRGQLESAGLPLEGVVLADGSGLHQDNRLTCRFLVSLLAAAGPDSPLAAGLAVAGESGTLAERMQGAAAGRIRAKTGSLRETAALSGFASPLVGDDLVFAYVANAEEVPESVLVLQELLASVLVRYPEGPPRSELVPVGATSPP